MKRLIGLLAFVSFAVLFTAGESDAQLLPRKRIVLTTSAPVVQPPAATPVEVGASKKLGPVACAAVRQHLRETYRKQGLGLAERVKKANQATDDVINGLMADAEKVAGQRFGAIGDGTILKVIIDFLNSPAGKALIEALIQLLIHSIG